jgi:putative intracellular protease/amidase
VRSSSRGPAALLVANLPGGRWLVAGRTLTTFTNEAERLNKTADFAPWLVETVLRACGAFIRSAGKPWDEHVTVDGKPHLPPESRPPAGPSPRRSSRPSDRTGTH